MLELSVYVPSRDFHQYVQRHPWYIQGVLQTRALKLWAYKKHEEIKFLRASVRYNRKVPPRLYLIYSMTGVPVRFYFPPKRISSSSIAGVGCSIAFDGNYSMKILLKVKRIAYDTIIKTVSKTQYSDSENTAYRVFHN